MAKARIPVLFLLFTAILRVILINSSLNLIVDYDFTLTQKRDDAQYLTDGVRYFADKRSMAFPTEDRARIFYYAMTQGNAELFENEVLQSKLKLVCEGIREAYNLKKYAEVLPWEQYLAEPMTP